MNVNDLILENSENWMCRLAKLKIDRANLSNLYPLRRIIFKRNIYIKNNIHLISPTPKFTLGVIQIVFKSLSTICQCLVQ